LYSDPARLSDAAFGQVENGLPALDATTSDGVRQRLWRLTDARAQGEVVRFIADKKIYIADGHHRYETMLALREELRRETNSSLSSVEYGTIFLANMDDPGLLVFATHRVLHGLASFDRQAVLQQAARFFDVEEAPLQDAVAVVARLAEKGHVAPSFALATADGLAYLTLRRDVDLANVPSLRGPAVLRTLDVTLLHGLLFELILGIDHVAQEQQTHLRYLKDSQQAIEAARTGAQAVFLMNPTPVAHVKAVADAGEVMPQKSTFFYPKLASGLVINPIVPTEDV
jgi:uncharacterized protein (DUF1015 family)